MTTFFSPSLVNKNISRMPKVLCPWHKRNKRQLEKRKKMKRIADIVRKEILKIIKSILSKICKS